MLMIDTKKNSIRDTFFRYLTIQGSWYTMLVR